MKEYLFTDSLMGYSIQVRLNVLDDGIHVLVVGGCRTHVGAVSYAFPGQKTETIQFPTHKDGVVSERWAGELCREIQVPVVVNCGIHYDNVSRSEIQEIVCVTETLLQQALYSLHTSK